MRTISSPVGRVTCSIPARLKKGGTQDGHQAPTWAMGRPCSCDLARTPPEKVKRRSSRDGHSECCITSPLLRKTSGHEALARIIRLVLTSI